MKKTIIYVFLFLLIGAICLSPRFSVGSLTSYRNIDLRVEDFLILFGVITILSAIFFKKIPKSDKSGLFWPIFLAVLIGFFSILFDVFLRGFSPWKFLYFAKEIEFFVLYFLVFYLFKHLKDEMFLYKALSLFGIINISWIFYVILSKDNRFFFYGPNAFMEPKGPFPSGGFFLMVFILLFNFFIFYIKNLEIKKWKKILFFIISVLPIMGIICSGSRAGSIGMIVSLFVTGALFLYKKINKENIKIIIIFFLISLCLFILLLYLLPVNKRVLSFNSMIWEVTSTNYDSRITILKQHWQIFSKSIESVVLGVGVFGEAHSQYMRILLERGIIGFIVFCWMILCILNKSWKGFLTMEDRKKAVTASAISATFSMLVMSIPNDPFMVVKIAEVYWFIIAVSMAAI